MTVFLGLNPGIFDNSGIFENFLGIILGGRVKSVETVESTLSTTRDGVTLRCVLRCVAYQENTLFLGVIRSRALRVALRCVPRDSVTDLEMRRKRRRARNPRQFN